MTQLKAISRPVTMKGSNNPSTPDCDHGRSERVTAGRPQLGTVGHNSALTCVGHSVTVLHSRCPDFALVQHSLPRCICAFLIASHLRLPVEVRSVSVAWSRLQLPVRAMLRIRGESVREYCRSEASCFRRCGAMAGVISKRASRTIWSAEVNMSATIGRAVIAAAQ